MYKVGIFTEDKGWQSWHINGCEAAYEAYRRACDLCEAVGADNAAIWDVVTCELLASFADEKD